MRARLDVEFDRAILAAGVGHAPTLADVIRLVHPKPASAKRRALHAWIIGKPCDVELLPQPLRDRMRFRETGKGPLPTVPFQLLTRLPLTRLPLTRDHWASIAKGASWQMLRQNLNAFLCRGVLDDPAAVDRAAATLRASGAPASFPTSFWWRGSAWSPRCRKRSREALDAALELSVANLPRVAGSVAVCPDVSGSMTGSVTGFRKGATSTVRHIDVAALVAAAMLRANSQALVLPFEHGVHEVRLDVQATIRAKARALTALGGGGTNCSAPLAWLIAQGMAPDLVAFVSDSQSWVDAPRGAGPPLCWSSGSAFAGATPRPASAPSTSSPTGRRRRPSGRT